MKALAVVALLLTGSLAVAPAPDDMAGEPVPDPRVRLTTPLGDIVVEVDLRHAPVTAANFLAYVDQGRFRGARFYRVVTPANQPDNPVRIEVIQGGLTMEGGHPQELPPIRHESTAETGLTHTDGVISMARDEPGTATSEFFITVGDQPELDHGGRRNPDGQGFAAFGRVVEGMEVVRAIQRRPEEGQMLVEPMPITAVERLPAAPPGRPGEHPTGPG
jgi:peptidyl-prolyl cis-trans isomerase A (cyclophilin A)